MDEILNEGQDSIERQSKLYKFMKENPSFKAYTAIDSYSMYLPDANIDSSFADPDNPDNPDSYFLLKIDNEFQNVFKLKCAKGRLFSDEDFKDTGDEIPLLLGYDFQKYYNVGDVITDYRNQRYKVVGFLEKSSFYVNPIRGEVIYWLDKAFVEPLQPHRFDEGDYYSATEDTFIITDNPENLQAIQEKSNELRLHTFEFRSFTEQLRFLLEYNKDALKQWELIASAILFFAIIGFVTNLVQFITTHTKEFAIHLLCGGKISSIIQRILIQVFLVIFIADIIVVAIHKFSLVSLLTVASSILIGLIIIIYPVIILSKTQINTILKRSQ